MYAWTMCSTTHWPDFRKNITYLISCQKFRMNYRSILNRYRFNRYWSEFECCNLIEFLLYTIYTSVSVLCCSVYYSRLYTIYYRLWIMY
jgi:hypothetical protein